MLPKLDDIYIRVLPALEDIKQRARKEQERENVTLKVGKEEKEQRLILMLQELREQAQKVEKIMDMVEDLKESGPGGMERGIKVSPMLMLVLVLMFMITRPPLPRTV